MGKIIVFAAPSGSGKSTIINKLLEEYKQLEFSISATSRAPRGQERDGVEYHFLSHQEFLARAEAGEFVEWEEVYQGSCYGTLRSEIERIWAKDGIVVFDIDVKGAENIKNIFGDDALTLFIMPPSVEELRKRLVSRGTDSPEAIDRRVSKAEQEIAYSSKFDKIVVNDNLDAAMDECRAVVEMLIS